MHIVFYQSLFIIPGIPVVHLVQGTGTSAGVRQYLHADREGPVKHVVNLRKDLAKYRDYRTFHRGVRSLRNMYLVTGSTGHSRAVGLLARVTWEEAPFTNFDIPVYTGSS